MSASSCASVPLSAPAAPDETRLLVARALGAAVAAQPRADSIDILLARRRRARGRSRHATDAGPPADRLGRRPATAARRDPRRTSASPSCGARSRAARCSSPRVAAASHEVIERPRRGAQPGRRRAAGGAARRRRRSTARDLVVNVTGLDERFLALAPRPRRRSPSDTARASSRSRARRRASAIRSSGLAVTLRRVRTPARPSVTRASSCTSPTVRASRPSPSPRSRPACRRSRARPRSTANCSRARPRWSPTTTRSLASSTTCGRTSRDARSWWPPGARGRVDFAAVDRGAAPTSALYREVVRGWSRVRRAPWPSRSTSSTGPSPAASRPTSADWSPGLARSTRSGFDVVGLAPRGATALDVAPSSRVRSRRGVAVASLTQLWSRWPLGRPARPDVVHATSMAGPFGGGAARACTRVAMHDLLWRDEPGPTTRSGIRFHETRLQLIARREDLRVITTSPRLERTAGGRAASTASRLTLCDSGSTTTTTAAPRRGGVAGCSPRTASSGPFTLYAGTREPRKNLGRLVAAHRAARAERRPTRAAGPRRTGGLGRAIDTGDAVVLGAGRARDAARPLPRRRRSSPTCRAPRGGDCHPSRRCTPGARVVASTTTPSVATNDDGRARRPARRGVDRRRASSRRWSRASTTRARRRARASVADLTWRNVRPRPPGGVAVKVALDVSAVPTRVAGAGRYVVELARRLPAAGVDTTLVTRRDDDDAMARLVAPAPTSRRSSPTSRGRRVCSTRRGRWARRASRARPTCGTRRTTRCRAAGRRRPWSRSTTSRSSRTPSGTSAPRWRSSAGPSATRRTHARVLDLRQ